MVEPLLGTGSSLTRLWELFGVGKRLFLWNTNRVEIAVCLPDGKMEVVQVPFVSYPHCPPTLQLYSTVWLSWSNIWFVSHTYPLYTRRNMLVVLKYALAGQPCKSSGPGAEHWSCPGDWHGASGRDGGWGNRLGKRVVGGKKETVEGRVR